MGMTAYLEDEWLRDVVLMMVAWIVALVVSGAALLVGGGLIG